MDIEFLEYAENNVSESDLEETELTDKILSDPNILNNSTTLTCPSCRSDLTNFPDIPSLQCEECGYVFYY